MLVQTITILHVDEISLVQKQFLPDILSASVS